MNRQRTDRDWRGIPGQGVKMKKIPWLATGGEDRYPGEPGRAAPAASKRSAQQIPFQTPFLADFRRTLIWIEPRTVPWTRGGPPPPCPPRSSPLPQPGRPLKTTVPANRPRTSKSPSPVSWPPTWAPFPIWEKTSRASDGAVGGMGAPALPSSGERKVSPIRKGRRPSRSVSLSLASGEGGPTVGSPPEFPRRSMCHGVEPPGPALRHPPE